MPNIPERDRSWRIVLASLLFLGMGIAAPAHAQMDFSLDEGEGGGEGEGEGEGEGSMDFGEGEAGGEGEGGDGMDFGLDEGGEGGDDGGGGGDIIADLAGGDDGLGDDVERAPRQTETVEEVYAVQQIYALRLNRVEFAPSASFTLNDPYIAHPAAGVALNYWFTNVLALGVNFNWFQWGPPQNRESDLNFFVRRSTRLGIPVNEWQLGAYLNFTYVPFYGKFAVFNEFIFQWDAYIVGGVGIMRTRPIPVIDPEIRQFDFQNRVAFNLGIGIRIFLSRFFGVFIEFRDYAFLEKFENLEVAVEGDRRANPDTWLSDSTTFSNNATVQVGLTIFFPFTFEYNLPK